MTGAGTVICPTASKIYIVKNAAGQNITVKTVSGTGILVPNGRTTFLFCDGYKRRRSHDTHHIFAVGY